MVHSLFILLISYLRNVFTPTNLNGTIVLIISPYCHARSIRIFAYHVFAYQNITSLESHSHLIPKISLLPSKLVTKIFLWYTKRTQKVKELNSCKQCTFHRIILNSLKIDSKLRTRNFDIHGTFFSWQPW